MHLIEIRCPAGSLDPADRAALADDVVHGLVGDQMVGDVPEETLRRAQTLTHVAFAELDGWTTGAGRWQQGDAPLLWITVTVPEMWRAEMSPYVIGWLRTAVRQLDDRRGWQRSSGDLWINVTGVADRSIGLDGRPATADDVLAVMTEEFRARTEDAAADLPEGVVIDPMCGMRVRLGKGAITLEHNGVVLGFCAQNCRDAYARQEGIAPPS